MATDTADPQSGMTRRTRYNPAGLASYIRSLPDFAFVNEPMTPYSHVGATLTDAVLQAGVRYETVVSPRVRRLRETFPSHVTTSQFLGLLEEKGTEELLDWKAGTKKAVTLVALAEFFTAQCVETEEHLRDWLSKTGHAELLGDIKGIGPKTIDYLRLLVGLPAVAVDVHLRRFLQESGVDATDYADARRALVDAAEELGLPMEALDFSLWKYMSSRRKPGTPKGRS
jgi:endonuclease III